MEEKKKIFLIVLFVASFLLIIFGISKIYVQYIELKSAKNDLGNTKSALELTRKSIENSKNACDCANAKNDNQKVDSDCESSNRQLGTIQSTLISPLSEYTKKIKFWNVYSSDKYKFKISYPNTLLIKESTDSQQKEFGTIVEFLYFNEDARSLYDEPMPGYFTYATISYWNNINNSRAKGGDNGREYKNLEELFSDKDSFIKKNKEIEISGKKAYDVSISGHDVTHAIMMEHNNGVYRIDISSDETAEKILASFVFFD
ncbi:MAG: PsbP-related protein [Candidatus Moraniibacteriota bacterium]